MEQTPTTSPITAHNNRFPKPPKSLFVYILHHSTSPRWALIWISTRYVPGLYLFDLERIRGCCINFSPYKCFYFILYETVKICDRVSQELYSFLLNLLALALFTTLSIVISQFHITHYLHINNSQIASCLNAVHTLISTGLS